MSIVSILIFIVILGLLVLVHEVGHFVSARLFKIGVDEFGVGFPPRITGFRFKRNGKPGNTLYSLNWIPIGGFVKIKGVVGGDQLETEPKDAAEIEQLKTAKDKQQHSDDFSSRPIWQRITVLGAGIIMNFVLAIVLLATGYIVGTPASTSNLPENAVVMDQQILVVDAVEESAALASGIEPGDALLQINDTAIEAISDVRVAMESFNSESDSEVTVVVERDDSTVTLQVEPTELSDGSQGLGVYLNETGLVRLPIISAITLATTQTGLITVEIFKALGGMLGGLVGLGDGAEQIEANVAGPIGIASLTHEAAQLGITALLQFAAVLSINLGIFNLLPIPALDGGRLLFVVIEGVIRRPVNQKVEAVIHNVGFLVLLLLIAAVTIKDVISLF